MSATAKDAPKRSRSLVALLCFATLASLAVIDTEDSTIIVTVLLSGVILGFVMLVLFGWMLSLFNSGIKKKYGRKSIRWIVNRGFLLLFPFTVLALIAAIELGWEATAAFASAGIMTSSTAIGAELTRLGSGKIRSTLLPVIGGIAMTTIWMIVLSGLTVALRG
ncbi:MAG: hypothetical protein GY727_14705 [Gammaproteobacteria bacterium]|nr:hypothetical protein [Gammaproteobacteria bacterium]